MQGLLKLHEMAASAQLDGRLLDWVAIRRAVLRTKPPYEASVENMISFVAARAGGLDGPFLKFLNAFFGQFVSSSKKQGIPNGLYRELADFPLHYVALAVWETAYGCPPDKVGQGGVCEWVTIADVVALGRLVASSEPEEKYDMFPAAFVLESAEKILSQARVRLPAAGIKVNALDHDGLLAALVQLDMRMAMFLLKKQDGAKSIFTSPGGPLQEFKRDLSKAFPEADVSKFDDLWRERAGPKKPERTAIAQEAASVIQLATVDQTGSLQSGRAKLRLKGWDVGTVATKHPTDPSEGMHRIIEVNDSIVVLEALDAPVTRTQHTVDAFLADGWRLGDEKQRKELLQDWGKLQVFKTSAGDLVRRRATVLAALGNLAGMQHKSVAASVYLDIFVKPARKVVVKREASAGQIVLLPETLDLRAEMPGGPKFAKLGAALPGFTSEGLVEVTLSPPFPGRFFLGPADKPQCMSPLWFVRTSADQAEVNLEWASFEVQGLSGADFHEGSSGTRPATVISRRIDNKRKKDSLEDGISEDLVRIPVLINTTPLQKGTELVAFKPSAPKRDKEMAAITYASLSKRAAK